jgi:hypothetical protein
MKNPTQCYAALLATCCLLFAGSLYAAKTPKVDICHYDADQGIYKPISVSINAEQKHLDNHGDLYPNGAPGTASVVLDADCKVSVNPLTVLAVAYINVDEEAGYGEKDIAIAELLDADDNGSINPGDLVRLGEYPTSFNPCPYDNSLERVCTSDVAAFVSAADDTSSPVITITEITGNTANYVAVSNGTINISFTNQGYVEHFNITNDSVNDSVNFFSMTDGKNSGDVLKLSANTYPFIDVNDELNLLEPQSDDYTDGYFFNVYIISP